jgi:RNA-binding protein
VSSELTPLERRDLSARAHHLSPVVTVGQKGLTESVLREIDRALTAHELIKVRVDGDDRAARTAMLDDICARTGASAVKQVGKVLILWRARPLETT